LIPVVLTGMVSAGMLWVGVRVKKTALVDVGLLLGLWLVWGYSWVASKLGLAYASPLLMSEYRLTLAAIALGALLLWRGNALRPTPFWPTFWIGLTQTAGFTLLSSLALLNTSTGKVTILCYTMPFWTLLLARLFLSERLRRVQWAAVLLALGGLISLLEPWAQSSSWLSSLLAMAAGISWAISAILVKRLQTSRKVDTLSLTFWQLLYGLVPLYLVSACITQPAVNWQPTFWLILLFNGCIAAGLGWLVWLHLLSRLSAGTAGLNMLAIPAVAMLCSWLQLGDIPSLGEAVGMGLVAMALALLAAMNLHQARQSLVVSG